MYRWEGSGVDEIGKNKATGEVLVRINPKFYRPTEVVSSTIIISWEYCKLVTYYYCS